MEVMRWVLPYVSTQQFPYLDPGLVGAVGAIWSSVAANVATQHTQSSPPAPSKVCINALESAKHKMSKDKRWPFLSDHVTVISTIRTHTIRSQWQWSWPSPCHEPLTHQHHTSTSLPPQHCGIISFSHAVLCQRWKNQIHPNQSKKIEIEYTNKNDHASYTMMGKIRRMCYYYD